MVNPNLSVQERERVERIAGALFDFAGFLTSTEEGHTFGAKHDAAPMVDLLREWAAARGLSLDEANVMGWNRADPPERKEPTDG